MTYYKNEEDALVALNKQFKSKSQIINNNILNILKKEFPNSLYKIKMGVRDDSGHIDKIMQIICKTNIGKHNSIDCHYELSLDNKNKIVIK